MQGELKMYKVDRDGGKIAIKIMVYGNVGQAHRDRLDMLGMEPVTDIANCRAKIVCDADELRMLRDILINEGIVATPKK